MGKDSKISDDPGKDPGKAKKDDGKKDDGKKEAKAAGGDKGAATKEAPEATKADDKGAGNGKAAEAKKDDDKSGGAKKDNGAEAKVEAAPTPAPTPAPAPAPTPVAKDDGAVVLLPPDGIDLSVSPESPAPAPGIAPAGDARSLRRASGGAEEFCLIYRHRSYLIRRQGKVGTVGEWSITEYPSIGAAAHAYAQECSELTGEGFSDLRG